MFRRDRRDAESRGSGILSRSENLTDAPRLVTCRRKVFFGTHHDDPTEFMNARRPGALQPLGNGGRAHAAGAQRDGQPDAGLGARLSGEGVRRYSPSGWRTRGLVVSIGVAEPPFQVRLLAHATTPLPDRDNKRQSEDQDPRASCRDADAAVREKKTEIDGIAGSGGKCPWPRSTRRAGWFVGNGVAAWEKLRTPAAKSARPIRISEPPMIQWTRGRCLERRTAKAAGDPRRDQPEQRQGRAGSVAR